MTRFGNTIFSSSYAD